MKNPSYILVIIFFIYPISNLIASGQSRDILIYNKEKLSIRDYPLEALYGENSIRPDFFDNKNHKICSSTGCNRGYVAEWEIIENQLYLINIFNVSPYCEVKEADLKKVFGKKCINGKVRAYWFTDRVIAEKGTPLYITFDNFISPYETEFNFFKGHLTEIKYYDNSKSIISVYYKNDKLRRNFINNSINWSSIPELGDKQIRVEVLFFTNENGKIDSASVNKNDNKVLDDEAIRVIKSLPEWNIYYSEGKFLRSRFRLIIDFSEELRKKYYKP